MVVTSNTHCSLTTVKLYETFHLLGSSLEAIKITVLKFDSWQSNLFSFIIPQAGQDGGQAMFTNTHVPQWDSWQSARLGDFVNM